MKCLLAVGAYGRRASREDWDAGRDFKILKGPYFSKRDMQELVRQGYTSIAFYGVKGEKIVEVFYVELV